MNGRERGFGDYFKSGDNEILIAFGGSSKEQKFYKLSGSFDPSLADIPFIGLLEASLF